MLRKPDEDLFENSKMSFGDHLEELRGALFKAVIALFLGVLVGFLFGQHVVRFIQTPLQAGLREFRNEQMQKEFNKHLEQLKESGEELPEDREAALKLFKEQGLAPQVVWLDAEELQKRLEKLGFGVTPPDNPTETDQQPTNLVPLTMYKSLLDDPRTRTMSTEVQGAFMVYVKAAVLVGVVLSSPLVFYFLWNFVATGLYQHERKYVYLFMPFSIGLFLLGAVVAFFFVFQFVLEFLFGFYGWLEIDPMPQIGAWINFALLLPVGFGIGFQLPLVMLFLDRIGVFSVTDYLKNWRIAILVIFIASMILTPADPQSMLLLACPLTVLYFGGILLCRFMPRRTNPFGEMVE